MHTRNIKRFGMPPPGLEPGSEPFYNIRRVLCYPTTPRGHNKKDIGQNLYKAFSTQKLLQ